MRGLENWTKCRENLPRLACSFCEKILLRGQNDAPETCCMKFNWFEFVRHAVVTN